MGKLLSFVKTLRKRSLQLSSSDSSKQFEVWSQLWIDETFEEKIKKQKSRTQVFNLTEENLFQPLFYVDALAVVACELSFRAGCQLDRFHLTVDHLSCEVRWGFCGC